MYIERKIAQEDLECDWDKESISKGQPYMEDRRWLGIQNFHLDCFRDYEKAAKIRHKEWDKENPVEPTIRTVSGGLPTLGKRR